MFRCREASRRKQGLKRRAEARPRRKLSGAGGAQTEIENLKHLAKLEAIEEETKKKLVVAKVVYSGPKIR